MKFTKMHGCGNDYVYVNCFEEKVENISETAVKISHRHFGAGSDGLVLICPSESCDVRMRMFNSDGSEAEMCGNAIRCVGKFVHDRGITDKTVITVETLGGVKVLDMKLDEKGKVSIVEVDMGEPILKPELVPVKGEGEGPVKDLEITVCDKTFKFTCVSMGNPHAVTVVDDVDGFDVEKYGSQVEINENFPRKTNTEFMEVVDETHLKMKVWERGAGETWACGTGTCATVVSAILNGICKKDTDVSVKLLGGTLTINWSSEDNHVYMTGPAEFVYDGVWFE
ncbi:MAG: diaminopimelate epimerase [Clostridiales bacterium]|nr:diaminopimelate epimerase [Clostridiales bacterium]